MRSYSVSEVAERIALIDAALADYKAALGSRAAEASWIRTLGDIRALREAK